MSAAVRVFLDVAERAHGFRGAGDKAEDVLVRNDPENYLAAAVALAGLSSFFHGVFLTFSRTWPWLWNPVSGSRVSRSASSVSYEIIIVPLRIPERSALRVTFPVRVQQR